MNARWILLWLAFGCRIPPVDRDPPVQVELTTPELSEFTLVCEADRERWQLDAKATSWTGGGEWWWTTDGTYLERHQVYSRKAAKDGSWDELRLRLDIVGDWRDAEKNKSTPFLCASEPTGRFVLFNLEGEVVDCQDEGPNTEWLDNEEEIPDCSGI